MCVHELVNACITASERSGVDLSILSDVSRIAKLRVRIGIARIRNTRNIAVWQRDRQIHLEKSGVQTTRLARSLRLLAIVYRRKDEGAERIEKRRERKRVCLCLCVYM